MASRCGADVLLMGQITKTVKITKVPLSNHGRDLSLSTAVVCGLAKYIDDKGHHLYYKYFSSVELAEQLCHQKTYCCGTACFNRRKCPAALKRITQASTTPSFWKCRIGRLEQHRLHTVSLLDDTAPEMRRYIDGMGAWTDLTL